MWVISEGRLHEGLFKYSFLNTLDIFQKYCCDMETTLIKTVILNASFIYNINKSPHCTVYSFSLHFCLEKEKFK